MFTGTQTEIQKNQVCWKIDYIFIFDFPISVIL